MQIFEHLLSDMKHITVDSAVIGESQEAYEVPPEFKVEGKAPLLVVDEWTTRSWTEESAFPTSGTCWASQRAKRMTTQPPKSSTSTLR